jgi:TPP-dependent pyruvate/acetoin dehydrogenase alpha subunit
VDERFAGQFQPESAQVEPIGVLSSSGTLTPGYVPALSDDGLVDALKLMIKCRAFDRRGTNLQRQGRFGTFSSSEGQEASSLGAALAVDPSIDWIVPQYRELPALLQHGLPLDRFIAFFLGSPGGVRIPDDVRVLPIQIALAAQLPHAVGLGWGEQLQGTGAVVLTFVGDGGTSEGDFHEACNLAGVVSAPVVFFVQNNGFALSTPRELQSRARSLASRALGYGMTGVVVDGNDLLAVHDVTAAAVRRARSGAGPTLIEAMTHRLGPHNTADDPTRYVDPVAHERAMVDDPVSRLRRYLESRGVWDADSEAAWAEQALHEVDMAFEAAWEVPTDRVDLLFDHVFTVDTPRLRIQRLGLGGTARPGP